MKDNNYIIIQGWMINNLDLKFSEIGLFALIYGFSQDGESKFEGSQKYMCKALQTTRPTLRKMLDKLIEKGYVYEHKNVVKNVTFNSYIVPLHVVKKFTGGSKETLQGGSKETLHYNTNINNTNNKTKQKEVKKETKEAEPYFNNAHLNDLFIQHLELRKTMHKNINTPQAVKLLITKLTNLSNKDPKKAEQLITNAILNGWKSYFPLKDGFNQSEQLTPKYTSYKPQ